MKRLSEDLRQPYEGKKEGVELGTRPTQRIGGPAGGRKKEIDGTVEGRRDWAVDQAKEEDEDKSAWGETASSNCDEIAGGLEHGRWSRQPSLFPQFLFFFFSFFFS